MVLLVEEVDTGSARPSRCRCAPWCARRGRRPAGSTRSSRRSARSCRRRRAGRRAPGSPAGRRRRPPASRLRMVSSVSARTGLPATAGSASNFASAHSSMSMLTTRRRPEAAALDEDRLLAQHLARLQHRAVRAEHRRPAQAELHQLERHQPVVDPAELDAAELDHVDLDAAGGQASSRLSISRSGSWCWKNAAVQQVDADDAERLLLERRPRVEHADVDDDLARLVARVGLELARPSSRGTRCRPGSCGRRRCRRRRRRRWCRRGSSPSRSRLSSNSWSSMACSRPCGDVALGLAVDGVADRHVVGRDGLGDGARRRRRPGRTSGRLPGRRRSRRRCRTSAGRG